MVRLVSAFILILGLIQAQAIELLDIPKDGKYIVVDEGNVLDGNQEAYLSRKLDQHYLETSNEIVIVTVRTLEGESIQEYSLNLAEKWKIGRKGQDNGILIFAAIEDRKVFIQVGRGLEGAVPDVYASRIVRNVIVPNFKNGNFGKGFDEATDVIIGLIKGEFQYSAKEEKGKIPVWVIVLIVIIVLIIISRSGKDGRTYDHKRSRRLPRTTWIGGGGGSIGGGGGWSGGGGFGGGFGGGSFGGGGAGGSW
jgi:uncharacterized protein